MAALTGLGISSPVAAAAASGAASPATSGPGSATATPRGSTAVLAVAAEAAAVRYVSLITAAMCQWLPDYWTLTQQRLPTLVDGSDPAASSMVERGMVAAERSVAGLLAAYRSAVQAVLADPSASGLTHTGLLTVASELAAGCKALHAAVASGDSGAGSGSGTAAPPDAATECLQVLTENAVLASLAQLSAHLRAAVAQLCESEDYRLTPLSRRAGSPATASVAELQALVQQGMGHLQAALAVAATAEVQPLRKSAAPARAAFLGCFAAYAGGCDALAASTLADLAASHSSSQSLVAEAAVAAAAASGSGTRRAAATLSPTRRLLVLCANLGAVRARLLPQQFARWSGLLQAGGAAKELQTAAAAYAGELEDVETRLGRAYIDRKQVREL